MNLSEVAKLIGADLFADPEAKVKGVSSPQNPKEGTLVFCQSEEDIQKAVKGKPVALVVKEKTTHYPCLVVRDVREALAIFLEKFYPEEHPVGVSDKAVLGKDVSLGKDVYIGPFCVIEDGVILEDGVKIYPFSYIGKNSVVGEGSVIFSGVVIYPNTVIGRRVRIHSGAVIGADGFGYHVTGEGIRKLNHIGNVILEDDVEIGANTTVDRALIDSTVVGKSTKVDNLVMIAHNCFIGEENIIVSQVGISGSVRTGRRVTLAGQVGVADHVSIGDGATVTAKSGVSKSLEGGKVYGAGIPAMEWSRWKRIYAYLMKLPDLLRGRK